MREIKFRLIKDGKIVGYEKHILTLGIVQIFHSYKSDDEKDYEWWNVSIHNSYQHFIDHDDKEQYTGLKDKNGKEIYEGDIVKVFADRRPKYVSHGKSQYDKRNIETRSVVIFDSFMWRLDIDTEFNRKVCELKGGEKEERMLSIREDLYRYFFFQSEHKNSKFNREKNSHAYWLDIEIIGNIHENPELLN